jgi:dUTP pyrophosphatase
MIQIEFIKRLEQAQLPVYASEEAAGADVHSARYYILNPKETRLIDTGLDCKIPAGYEIQVRSRSGLALKHNVIVFNSPGTVDSDYTGGLGVILHNAGDTVFEVHQGDRIAQLVVAPTHKAVFSFTDSTKETARGAGGFGSTGV